jgi:hypothetical protein
VRAALVGLLLDGGESEGNLLKIGLDILRTIYNTVGDGYLLHA